MKNSMLRTLSALAMVFASSAAFGGTNDIELGEAGYGGTGCPNGSASVTLSPDQKTLSILFDQYVVEAGGETGRVLDRKGCNISIPVKVPHGYAISLIKVDYRGFNFLPRSAQSTFSVEYFFAGSRGPLSFRNFRGPLWSGPLVGPTPICESIQT
jgi:hypothetical protein